MERAHKQPDRKSKSEICFAIPPAHSACGMEINVKNLLDSRFFT